MLEGKEINQHFLNLFNIDLTNKIIRVIIVSEELTFFSLNL